MQNKSHLIKAAANSAKLTPSQVSKVVDAIFDTIITATANGDDVRLIGFGTFTTSQRSARTGRNPRTGATIKIAARKVPKFRPGKEFKDAVA